jgi:ABC-type phosphate/phosphonate transport system ATPase subunit
MEQELQMITKMENNVQWFNLHYTSIREKYENKFIAIKDNRIIADADKVETLIKNIEKQGEDPGLTLIEFIPEKGTVLIL